MGEENMKHRIVVCMIGILIFNIYTWSDSNVFAYNEKSITILFTHDLHDNFYPFQLVEEGKVKSVGGYTRLATAIKKEKEKDPQAILVDAGDYSMGTLFQTINTSDAPGLRMMGYMGYDVTTFGNHEFDYRAEGLAQSLHAAKQSDDQLPQIIASNMIFPTDEDGEIVSSLLPLKEEVDNYGVSNYLIMERNGVKIGFIGLMGKEAVDNSPMAGVNFENIVDSAKPIVAKLKDEEKVDLVIALSHSGTSDNPAESEDEILAKEVPGIDVIISGHTHTTLNEPIFVNNTVIASAGEYGKNLGVLHISKSTNANWQVDDYGLIPINDELELDLKVAEKVEYYKELVQAHYLDGFNMKFDETLAYTPYSFIPFPELGDVQQEEPIGNLIGDAYIHIVKEIEENDYVPIAAAVVPVGTIRDSIVQGDITVSNVFDIMPLGIGPDGVPGYPLVNIYLTGKELKTVAEVDASVSPIMPDAQLYIAGLSYTFNPNRLIFNKVTTVKLVNQDGTYENIDNNKLYRVVVGLYTAQMLPIVKEKSFNLLSIVPKTKDGEKITDFEKEIIYLDENKEKELKEWYALARFLASFNKVNGKAEVPAYYQEAQQRKIIINDKNLSSFFEKPNGIAVGVYTIILVSVGLIVSLIIWLIKRTMRIKA